jgi:hypothetical protein
MWSDVTAFDSTDRRKSIPVGVFSTLPTSNAGVTALNPSVRGSFRRKHDSFVLQIPSVLERCKLGDDTPARSATGDVNRAARNHLPSIAVSPQQRRTVQ